MSVDKCTIAPAKNHKQQTNNNNKTKNPNKKKIKKINPQTTKQKKEKKNTQQKQTHKHQTKNTQRIRTFFLFIPSLQYCQRLTVGYSIVNRLKVGMSAFQL